MMSSAENMLHYFIIQKYDAIERENTEESLKDKLKFFLLKKGDNTTVAKLLCEQ